MRCRFLRYPVFLAQSPLEPAHSRLLKFTLVWVSVAKVSQVAGTKEERLSVKRHKRFLPFIKATPPLPCSVYLG